MAEWSNAPDSKSGVRVLPYRGFESHSLRQPSAPIRPANDQLNEKAIEPLAPSANPKRFTDRAKVETAFGQNCMDVVGLACTAAEKADVLSWLLSLKP